jgi:hypothetical protein
MSEISSQHLSASPAGDPPTDDRPIFVVGCHRSGTTLFRLILDSHPRISCGPETRFLREFESVTNDENWPRMQLYGLPREWWDERFAAFFRDFKETYARSQGKQRWADKTPLYVNHLDYIDRLFPDCVVINIVRDGRDVARSHRETWGYTAGLKAIEKWPRYVEAAERYGNRVGPDRYLEVRYEDVVGNTEKTMRSVLAWLNEEWSDSVLHHMDFPHDVMSRYDAYTSGRRASGGESKAVYASGVRGGKQRLDPVMRALVRLRADGTLKRLGYK